MKNKNCGFTLLEMVVVIMIIGMLSTLAVGGNRALESYRFQSFTEEVVEMVQTAQQMATLRNGNYILMTGNKEGKPTFELKEGTNFIEKRLILPSQVTMSISTEEKQLQFAEDMSPTKAGTICIKHKGLQEELHITVLVATGKVSIHYGQKC